MELAPDLLLCEHKGILSPKKKNNRFTEAEFRINLQKMVKQRSKAILVNDMPALEGRRNQTKVTLLIFHTKSLNTNQESYFETKEQTVKLSTFKQTSKRKRKKRYKKRRPKRVFGHLKHVLTPPGRNSSRSSQERWNEKLKRKRARTQPKKRKKTPPLQKKMYKFHLVIDSTGKGLELIELVQEEASGNAPVGFTEKVLKLPAVTAQVFGNKCIQSNRAETFNSVHDQVLSYLGRKAGEQAQRDLDA